MSNDAKLGHVEIREGAPSAIQPDGQVIGTVLYFPGGFAVTISKKAFENFTDVGIASLAEALEATATELRSRMGPAS